MAPDACLLPPLAHAITELNQTKEPKRNQIYELLTKLHDHHNLITLNTNDTITKLADTYIHNKIIPRDQEVDALQVATATFNNVDIIINLNLKHIIKLNDPKNLRINQLMNNINNYFGLNSVKGIYRTDQFLLTQKQITNRNFNEASQLIDIRDKLIREKKSKEKTSTSLSTEISNNQPTNQNLPWR